MSAATAALVLASAFFHAAWNAMIKAEKDTTTAGVVVLALSGTLAGLLSLASRLPGLSALAPGPLFPHGAGISWALLSGLFETSYFLSLIWCLSRGPLGQVYSFSRGGALLLVWPLSVLFFHEPVLAPHMAGGLVVVAGLYLTGYEGAKRAPNALVAPLTICAGSIAGYHLLYKQAVADHAQPMAVFALSMLIAAPANVFWHRKALKVHWRDLRWPVLLAASVLCTSSFVLALVALTRAGAGWVLTLRNTSVVFALFFSWRLGEHIPKQRIWGTALIALGAILLGI